MRTSVRVRITAVVALTFAAALIFASVIGLAVVKGDVELSIDSDHHAVLDELHDTIRAGNDPSELTLTMDSDGTHFRIEDTDGDIIVSSAGVTAPAAVVLFEPSARDDNTPPFDRFDQRIDALADPGNWSRTEVPVATADGHYTLVALTPLDIANRRLSVFASSLWLVLPILVLALAAAAWLGTGWALKPVSRIINSVKGITERTLDERVPESRSGDEIDELARTMNGMLDRLDSSARRHRQFVSDASHELRSPITAITAEAEIALQRPETANWKTVAEVALSEGRRLERLVHDLLALATADEARTIQRRLVDLDDVLLNEVRRISGTAVSTSAISAAQVRGDPGLLSRLVANLLSNASRHAVSKVAVGLRAQEGRACLTIDDDGSGIPPVDRERVFERFARLEEARSRDAGGAGIGLALAKVVVSAHGGDISVSDSPLGGARFEVALPLARPADSLPQRKTRSGYADLAG